MEVKSRPDIAHNLALQRNCHPCHRTNSLFQAPRRVMFSDIKTDANNARELRREKVPFPLAHITGVLFFLDLVFSTSLLSGGLARATRQIARKTSGKKNSPYLLKFGQLRNKFL